MFLLTITIWVAEARISIKTGKQNNLRLIDVEKVVNGIDYENKASVCAALFGGYMSSLAAIQQVGFTVVGK